jgi:acetylornithine deacetylase/succinyl-diaminopimelate desuccinylase-like protein
MSWQPALGRDGLLSRVTQLAEAPSVSGEEDRISRVAAGMFRRDGLEVEEQEVVPGRRNVIARLNTGRPGPRLLFNGHLDTLPLPAGWKRDPYRPKIEEGKLYAGEINNMKAAVGAMAAAVGWLADHREMAQGEIVLSAVIGECDALGLGTLHMLERGLSADLCINGEPTDLAVMTAHAGVTQLRLTIRGRSAHVSQRTQGVNAIEKLVAMLPAFTEAALRFERHEDFPGLPTLNIGVIHGGQLPSMLAETAYAAIDVRTVPGMTPESVLADLQGVVENARRRDPSITAELELADRPVFCQERPFHISTDAGVVRAVAEAHEKVTGRQATVGTLVPQVFFGTDASHILAAGIPTAIYGPGKVTDINTPDESIAVDDVIVAAEVYLASALAICARDDRRAT